MMQDSLILDSFESGMEFPIPGFSNNISKPQSMNVYLCMIDFAVIVQTTLKLSMEITQQTIADIKFLAFKNKKENATFFRQVAAKPPGKVDEAFQNLHEQVFSEVNCLECANCCKSLGPKLNTTDIRRISSVLRIKASEFEQKYLRMDEDDDFVFSIMPCVFLDKDNSCKIYEDRPRACREYPHTDQRKMHQVLDITLKNISVCPAVFEIVERLKKVKI